MDKKKRNKMIAQSFLGFLGTASLFSVIGPKRVFSPSENRYLQKKPEFTAERFLDGSYGADYETYLSDQFPARDAWIGIKVMAELAQGRQDVNGVYFGKDGYLMEKFDTEDVEGEQLDKNLERLETFARETVNELGEDRVKVMLVPSAAQVLKNRLPFMAAPYDQSGVTEHMKDSLGEQAVVPVEDILVSHGEEAIYYRTDHHWTALGAYYGYRAWAKSMGIKPWEPEAYDIQTVSREFLGTVYSKVHVPHEPDSMELYLPKSHPDYEIYYDGAGEQSPMYTEKALDGKDKYSVYMDGNHGLTEVKNPDYDGEKGRKLLIIKDSFAHSFAPFAVNHYEETYMIDLRYFNLSPRVFMKEKGITDVLVLYQIPGFSKEKTVSKIAGGMG